MRKDFNRLILSVIVVLLVGAFAFGQEKEVEYKDVILDGKPAKLNVTTGEITLVNKETEKRVEEIKIDTVSVIKKDVSSDYHIVKEKETLLDIANLYNTTLTELKNANNLKSTLVDKGQRLRVRNFESAYLDTEVEPKPKEEVIEVNVDFHIVEKGQTLYSLANRYGLTVDELKKENGLTSNLIIVGQKLQVANFDISEERNQVSVWTVSKGDTLYNISKRNGITVEQIKSLNGLTSNLIKIGQKLQLQ